MERKKPARRAIVVAFLMFGSLFWIMSNSGELRLEKPETQDRRNYRVQLDVRGDLANDHKVVRDTLNHYLAIALPEDRDLSANWELNYCCEDKKLFALKEAPTRIFQWWGDFEFGNSENQLAFVRQLIGSDRIQIDRFQYEHGVLAGIASAQLPIPGQEGSITLEGVKFNLRTTSV